MNDPIFDCADVEALAAELALGIVLGAERASALEHLSSCSACRTRVEELAEVADELLLLGPEREPPAGFEGRVLSAGPTSTPAGVVPLRARRRLSLRVLSVAAAVLIAFGAVGAFIGNWLAPGPSALTRQYVAALHVMGGSALGAEKLHAVPGGQEVGEVFAYEGHPSWLFVSVWDTSANDDVVRLVMNGGAPVTVGRLRTIGDSNSIGADINADVTKLERVEVVDGRNNVVYRATFTQWWPKWSASGP